MHALRTLTAGPAVVMLGLAAALLPAPAAAASGDPTDDVVRDLSISIDLDEDGVMHVKETYDWDFGEREGLGFFRTLSTQMPSDEGPRVVDYEDFALTSPTGAPAAVADIEESRDALQLSLGAPEGSEDTRTGLQTYELSYTVHGAVDPSSWDWIVAGPDQDVSIERVTTEVTAPEEILDGACWQGTDSDLDDGRPCPAEIDGETMTATATTLEPGGWQGVEVTVPEGTFSAATPVYAEPTASERLADTIAPVSDRIGHAVLQAWWAAAAAGVAAVVGIFLLRRRSGRDEHFPLLAPGALPEPGATLGIARLEQEPPAVPRHAVPDDLSPYEAALLWRKSALFLPADFTTLTLVDLAARGHLHLEETTAEHDDDSRDWLASTTIADRSGLPDDEQDLLAALDAEGDGEPIRLSELGDEFSTAAQKAQAKALACFDARHLLSRRLGGAGSLWDWTAAAGITVLLVVTILAWALTMPTSLNLLLTGITGALLLLGVLWAATATMGTRRTALGRAHVEQLRGLQAAQAAVVETSDGTGPTTELTPDQITAQLPYAMALGEAKRWSALAEGSAAAGDSTLRPQGLSAGSWFLLATSMQHTIGASHSSSGAGSTGSPGFSAGSFGGGGGVAGR
ncbi:DUF2207 domain-containing protein [Nesterenkonia sp. CL21]|uniref:DUF2207 domain-containing protein n=1 Tax=Nesterenkonia sp. CL21 TaxID=3064894 RepID=UPI002878B7BE|nr:DUF2207 domain-containing protein [Nesterenkonia sp. CL21]MDS2173711.1 DUF2207 domain-containing protein [Nesterenkonia sp. CL21]